MEYINVNLADADDIEEINGNIDAILDILHIKGIIPSDIDHWNVIDYRNKLNIETENE